MDGYTLDELGHKTDDMVHVAVRKCSLKGSSLGLWSLGCSSNCTSSNCTSIRKMKSWDFQ